MSEADGLMGPFWKIASSIDAIVYVAELRAHRPLIFISPAVERFFDFTPEEWMARPDSMQEHVHPDDAEEVRGAVAEWLRDGAEPALHLKYRLVSKDGRICWCRETAMAAGSDEGPRTKIAGAIVDVTELKVLQNTLEAVSGAAHPQEALLAFCDALAQALALDHVAWVTPTEAVMVASYKRLGVRDRVEFAPWRPETGIAIEAMEQNAVLHVAASAGRRVRPSILALTPGVRFAIAAPVPGRAGPRGALLGMSRREREINPHQLRVVEALARQASAALQRAELVAELERTSSDRHRLADELVRAHEEERSRLARELHDGAGQTLTAVAIQLDLAERKTDEAARGPLRLARAQVEQTLEELRRLSHALRPAALDRLGFGEAIAEMCKAFHGEKLTVELKLPPDGLHLPPDHATALFRIAQSALTNVVRHASARTATVCLGVDKTARTVSLAIEDDGRGFVPAYAPGALGLLAMKERALSLGGDFWLEAAPGAGTRVRAVLPLP